MARVSQEDAADPWRYEPDPTAGVSRRTKLVDPAALKFMFLLLAIWAVLTAAVFALIAALDGSNQQRYEALIHHGSTTKAIVIGTDPSNHDTVSYSFSVAGQRYSSSDRSDPPNPPAGLLRVGQAITVVFDVRDPNVSCACNPRDGAAGGRWWTRLFAGAFVSSVVAVLLTLRLHRRWTSRSPRSTQ